MVSICATEAPVSIGMPKPPNATGAVFAAGQGRSVQRWKLGLP